MVSAIAVTRTGTLRAEENVVSLEKQKKKQDLLIDSINEEIKRKQEQKTILTAQLQSQRDERQQAIQILKEAENEMYNGFLLGPILLPPRRTYQRNGRKRCLTFKEEIMRYRLSRKLSEFKRKSVQKRKTSWLEYNRRLDKKVKKFLFQGIRLRN